ncbi:MAG: hypothetical protein ABIJ41_01655 [Candidatus Omnitrophota bacterium]
MSVFLYGLLLFGLSVCVHFCIWKIHAPKNHARALVWIFVGVYFISILLFLCCRGTMTLFGVVLPQTILRYTQFSFLFSSLAVFYVANYPSIEVDSPSMVMILAIAQKGREGLDKKTFEQDMNDDILVVPRVYDLHKGGMTYLEDNRYKLTTSGKLIARLFVFQRMLLGKKEKGG